MALFGRRKTKQLSDDELLELDEDEATAVRPEPAEGEPGVDRDWVRAEDGPYDITEWPEVDSGIDLGALRLPSVKGMSLRLDIEQNSGRVIGATLGFGASQAQVQVFAAPRSEGIWDELRAEIARGLVDSGGAAEAVDGRMGKELRARMPGRAPDGRVAYQPARFVGIDGPRWFLRVVIGGPAASDDNQARGVLAFVRRIVVSRGDEPRPPREVLTLTPPKGFAEAVAKEAEARREQQDQARRAAAADAVRKAPSAGGSSDATAVAGVGLTAGGGEDAPTGGGAPATPQPEPTDAPKAPRNPDFT
ncbi:hypothetical protein SGUI_0588 [Serinicoccus hydrothermalis]|uniref:DUF3710 domain-containing protein n=1 Tax=Serinicoccus hydrothermalis TaxID=1758689 RepID=A0A1B1N9A2_9MICO|nr:DUF3710 domain-containing protein [Serinicoccus hydrothermalis]ANS77984.1 hypothetical protein SGUI_0588 [Serinicoccus hydrothermalis]